MLAATTTLRLRAAALAAAALSLFLLAGCATGGQDAEQPAREPAPAEQAESAASEPAESPSPNNGTPDESNAVAPVEPESEMDDMKASTPITASTTVGEIMAMPEFGDFGRLLFPVDRPVNASATLEELANDGTYVWYSNLDGGQFARDLERLRADSATGQQVFYPIYSEAEVAADPSKRDTGLFFFRGDANAPFAIVNAGGGFAYVAALQDSFPHALEISELGANAFALIYRPDDPYGDLAKAVEFVYDHADELGVDREGYSLWGGSAGARMAATLGNSQYLHQLTGRSDFPQAAAVIMEYTGYSTVSRYDAPTFICVGTNDGIADYRVMSARAEALERLGIPTEVQVYEDLRHGFGAGYGTKAEGWIEDAVAFWMENR